MASPGPSRVRTLLAIAVLTVLSPLLAAVLVPLPAATAKMTASPQVQLVDFLDLLLFGFLLGYVLGWPYALITGVIVAAWSLWWRPTLFVALAAALAANAILYFSGPVLEQFIRLDLYRSALQAGDFLFFSLITVSVCWFIFRRMARL